MRSTGIALVRVGSFSLAISGSEPVLEDAIGNVATLGYLTSVLSSEIARLFTAFWFFEEDKWRDLRRFRGFQQRQAFPGAAAAGESRGRGPATALARTTRFRGRNPEIDQTEPAPAVVAPQLLGVGLWA